MSNIRNPKTDGEIQEYLTALVKLVPVFTPNAGSPSSPKESTRLAAIYDLAERTISIARNRLVELQRTGDDSATYSTLRDGLEAVCKRITPRPFPTSILKDNGYLLQVFQNITTAFSQLVLPANAKWYAERLAGYRLQYFNDFDGFLPTIDAARQIAARNPGVAKHAKDLAWTLHAALHALKSYPAQRESAAAPLFFELEQTVSSIPEPKRDQRLIDIVERHRQWIKSPPGELEGWELLAEFKAQEEIQELNNNTVEQFIRRYESLGLSVPSKLHSSVIRRLLANSVNAREAFIAFFLKHGPEAYSPDDYQASRYQNKTVSPIVLRVARVLADQLSKKAPKGCEWMAAFLDEGIAISSELNLLRERHRLAIAQNDQVKCRQIATQLVRQDPNWFKHWEMLADAIDDNANMKLSCLSAALLCPVKDSKFHSRVVSKWLKTAAGMKTHPDLDANLVAQLRTQRVNFSESPSIMNSLAILAMPVKESLFEDMKWIPGVIFSKGTRKKGVLEIAFILNKQKQLARTRLEQYPVMVQAKVGDPIAIRIQTALGKPHVVDVRTRPDGLSWDALPPIEAEVLGGMDIGNGIKIKSKRGTFVLPAKRFPDLQHATSGQRLALRLAINARTKLWEPVDAHFVPMPNGQTANPSMKGNTT